MRSILVWLCYCFGQWVRSDGYAGGQAPDQIAITTGTISKKPPLQERLETSWLKDKVQSMLCPRFHTKESPKGLPTSQILPKHPKTAQRGESLCICPCHSLCHQLLRATCREQYLGKEIHPKIHPFVTWNLTPNYDSRPKVMKRACGDLNNDFSKQRQC